MTSECEEHVADPRETVAELRRELAQCRAERDAALAGQAATAEILQLINASPGDLAPIFEAILEKAHALSGASRGTLFLFDGEAFRSAATHGYPEGRPPQVVKVSEDPRLSALTAGERLIHVPDLTQLDDPVARAVSAKGGVRTNLLLPLRKDGCLLGVLSCNRSEVQPFSGKEIALLENFAAQAVIAIENARLITETREALEQQTATAEVLRVINSSPGDLAPVFEAILDKVHRLCGATLGSLFLYDGELFRAAATHGYPEDLAEHLRRGVVLTATSQLLDQDIRWVHNPDLTQLAAPTARAVSGRGGVRTNLMLPLRKDGRLLGAISCNRTEVRPFIDKEIALIESFAAQAVIAMENARLLDELRARTHDLEESLEYQTATSDVLNVISRSTADVQPVLDTVTETAARLCGDDAGAILIREGEVYRFASVFGVGPEHWAALRQRRFLPGRDSIAGRAALEGRVVHVADIRADPDYALPEAVASGLRTHLGVPLLREGAVLGAISLARKRVEPYTERQIELVRTFADQAVIAMENARLIAETRAALEQQTATAEILRVISGSAADVQPVFDTIVEQAVKLCDAEFAGVARERDGLLHLVATNNLVPEEAAAFYRLFPRPADRGFVMGRAFLSGRPVVVEDVMTDPEYDHQHQSELLTATRYRTFLGVPIIQGGQAIGVIGCARRQAKAFTSEQIELVRTFADQAVIAIENTRLLTELRESLEQQRAIAEVLGVINSSPGDLAPVFGALLEKAMRLCEGAFGGLWRFEDDRYVASALRGVPRAYAAFLAETTLIPGPGSAPYRFLHGERSVLQNIDLADEELYRAGDPQRRALVDLGGARSALQVPLCKDDAVLGVITIYRQEVRPFADKQVALLQNFAAQAVIAMENARLLTETREALEQQTATAEVLGVINSSPGDLTPVFDAILEKAHHLCGAVQGSLQMLEGGRFHAVAARGLSAALAERLREGSWEADAPVTEPLFAGARFTQTDMAETDHPTARAALTANIRMLLCVPLRQGDTLLGMIVAARREPTPFSDKEIALLENFAAQAVIAIENARLLTELRESLAQQRAIAEVLQVINSSPGDLAPVFQTLLDKALALCGAAFGVLWTYDGEHLKAAALHGVPAAFAEFLTQGPHTVGLDNSHGRLLAGEAAVHVVDLKADAAYRSGDPIRRALVELGGGRVLLAVPLRKDDVFLGIFVIYRTETRPFSEKQIALLQNFASQAVIAMDNARLLGEIRQRQAELRVTFDNMGDGVAMFDAEHRLAAWNMNFQRILDLPDEFLAGRPSLAEYVRHLAAHGEYGAVDVEAEVRRLVAVVGRQWSTERTRPDGRVIEVRVNPVPDGGFVTIYGDITERKRAEAEIRAARDAAEKALAELKTAQASLVHAEKMASLGQLTAGIAHEIKNPLNFVNNFAGLSVELLDELKEAAAPAVASLGTEMRAEIDEIVDTLSGNLAKIGEHGKRADGIVTSMLAHSRGTTGERQRVDLNALVEEALNLAYHGARAQDQEFNIAMERAFEPGLAPIEIVPQDLTRVFLNLFGNGFYAARKRARETSDGFRPVLTVATRDLGHAIEITVRDNGAGIPPEIRGKLFQPFFTTKPTGEGTGLGLSISWDIVTQQHGGTLSVDSEPGQFTEFTVRLPRSAPASTRQRTP